MPLGPPLLSYTSTSKAMLQYNSGTKTVQLVADRAYAPGELLTAWCGPQPNSRLLLNYGLVDENNPYDKIQVGSILPGWTRRKCECVNVMHGSIQTWCPCRTRASSHF